MTPTPAAEIVERFYPCWCDGQDGCDGVAAEPFGLCIECEAFHHGRLPHMGLSTADMELMAVDVHGNQLPEPTSGASEGTES